MLLFMAMWLGIVHEKIVNAGTHNKLQRLFANIAWQILGITYFLVAYSQAKYLRERKIPPAWVTLSHPNSVEFCKKATPFILFLTILAIIFAV